MAPGLNFATNASVTAPLNVLSNAVGVIGKSVELVPPATYMFAAESSTSPFIPSTTRAAEQRREDQGISRCIELRDKRVADARENR